MVCQKDEFFINTAIILDSLGNFFFNLKKLFLEF